MRIVTGIIILLTLALPALAQGGPRLDAICVLDRKTGRAVYFPTAYMSYMDRSRWRQVSDSSGNEKSICWGTSYRAPLISVNEIFSGDRPRPEINVDRTTPNVNRDRTTSDVNRDRSTSEVERARSVADVNRARSVADVNGGQPGSASGDAPFMAALALTECVPRHAAAPVFLCPSNGQLRLMYAAAGSAVKGPLLASRSGRGTNPVSGQRWVFRYFAATSRLLLYTAYADGKPYRFAVYDDGRVQILAW